MKKMMSIFIAFLFILSPSMTIFAYDYEHKHEHWHDYEHSNHTLPYIHIHDKYCDHNHTYGYKLVIPEGVVEYFYTDLETLIANRHGRELVGNIVYYQNYFDSISSRMICCNRRVVRSTPTDWEQSCGIILGGFTCNLVMRSVTYTEFWQCRPGQTIRSWYGGSVVMGHSRGAACPRS